ncbi:hypothetical protein IWW46_005715, partial [Coemansia sp. RSA 2440]
MSPINNLANSADAAAPATASGSTAFKVDSPSVRYTDSSIESDYVYDSTVVSRDAASGKYSAKPTQVHYKF